MATFTFDTEIIRDEEVFLVEVEYACNAIVPETYYQPAEGGEVELIGVYCDDADFELTQDEEDEIYEMCRDRAEKDWNEFKNTDRRN